MCHLKKKLSIFNTSEFPELEVDEDPVVEIQLGNYMH